MAKLPILMYHHVSPDRSEGLTISIERLKTQFEYLVNGGFRTYHFSDLNDLDGLANGKGVVITFDDAYENQLEYAYPLLKKFGLKATFFAPLEHLGKTDSWYQSTHRIMTVEQLRSLDRGIIELGYHSYHHKIFNECSFEEIQEDIRLCLKFSSENDLNFSKIIAYPYGKYPRKDPEKNQLFKYLKDQGFHFGVRIGNRVNQFPFKEPFEIQRIDVKGEYSLSKLKRKLKYGKYLF